ncbi:MAG: hypothetical protein N5P05_003262 [Chroococcopsis gigantea SAG 12.99]|jgi:hypothetical protein|nr:hypothetical protein [Chroococcopsis gigantea SAG 12.99]
MHVNRRIYDDTELFIEITDPLNCFNEHKFLLSPAPLRLLKTRMVNFFNFLPGETPEIVKISDPQKLVSLANCRKYKQKNGYCWGVCPLYLAFTL